MVLGSVLSLLVSPGGRGREREGDKSLVPVVGSQW